MTLIDPARAPSIAVVGGGIAGMSAACALVDQGARVLVFDKGRGPGGRTSTRRRDDLRFDHGAQYFTARDERFERAVARWVDAGVASPWRGRIGQVTNPGVIEEKPSARVRYVGVPGMNAVVRHLASSLGSRGEVRFGVRVTAAVLVEGRWLLKGDRNADLGTFDALIVALPAPQAAVVLNDAPGLFEQALAIPMLPCWSVMASFDRRLPVESDGIFVNMESGTGDAQLSWVARDSSKPQRPPGEAWVLHGSPGWSEANIERDPREVAEALLVAFFRAVGISAETPSTLDAHRWRFANAEPRTSEGCLFDRQRLLAACGDWANGGRVEGAYLSGVQAAECMISEMLRRAQEQPTSSRPWPR
ncbi:MAG: FAD-dependent oxidoreductase [Phycisphaerales bacterium]|nr:MAG: FAD-dependent oxidoreductase [Phycisphaerales bacterium]